MCEIYYFGVIIRIKGYKDLWDSYPIWYHYKRTLKSDLYINQYTSQKHQHNHIIKALTIYISIRASPLFARPRRGSHPSPPISRGVLRPCLRLHMHVQRHRVVPNRGLLTSQAYNILLI